MAPTRKRNLLVGAIATLAVLLAIVNMELFAPLGGVYGNMAARYWIGRAAGEKSRGEKERHISRVALSSEYGSQIAKQAIDHVEEKHERCVLRTILAELPKVRSPDDRRAEAARDCETK